MPVVVAAHTRHKDASERRKNAAKKKRAAEAEGKAEFDALSPEDRAFIEKMFEEFDKDHDHALNKKELTGLMTKLNDGKIPSSTEVDRCMEQADQDKSGTIKLVEVQRVLTSWFCMVEEKKSSSACILL